MKVWGGGLQGAGTAKQDLTNLSFIYLFYFNTQHPIVTQQDTLLGQGLLEQDHTNLSFIYLIYVNT